MVTWGITSRDIQFEMQIWPAYNDRLLGHISRENCDVKWDLNDPKETTFDLISDLPDLCPGSKTWVRRLRTRFESSELERLI